MEAIEELAQLSDSMRQAASLLADEDVDETPSSASSKRPSTFLNVVALGNTDGRGKLKGRQSCGINCVSFLIVRIFSLATTAASSYSKKGAGKSAVLNSLIGHPALPTGEGGATRAPIRVDLTRDGSLSSKSIILQIDSKSQPVSASALRHSLQDRLSKISGKSRDEIYLNLRTSTAPPLKLIDLPGVDKGNLDDSLSQYAEHSDAILLVVIPATQAPEVASAKAIRIAKELDGECTRTVGVISKIDQASSEPKILAAVQALLLNQGPRSTSDIPWVALIGQSVSIASAQSGSVGADNSLETAWRAETESLKSILTGAPQSKLGRLALVETLAQQIRNRMKIRLPNLLSGLQGKSQIVQDELFRLGEQMVQSSEGTRALALELCREFEDKFLQHIMTGEGDGWKVVASFEGNFPNRIKQLPLDRHFDINNVKRIVLEADGYQPYLISPEKGLRSLIKGVLELAKEPSRLCVDEVHRVLVDVVSSAANATPGLGRYPPFKREVVAIATAALEGFKNEAKTMVVALVDMERAFVPPQHFIRLVQRRFLMKRSGKRNGWSRKWFVLNEKTGKLGYTKKQEERHFRGVITLEECNLEEILEEEEAPTKSSKDKKANGPDAGKAPSLAFKLTSRVPYKTVLKCTINSCNPWLPKLIFKLIQQLTRSSLMSCSSERCCLKAETMAEKTEWLNKLRSVISSKGGQVKGESGPPMRHSLSDGSLDTMPRRPVDPEEELRWMAQEVRGYVEAVLNSLAANVPKAVVLCQVEKAKEDMLNKLYSSVSAQSMARIEELLQEDQNVKGRRERYQKQSSLLSKLTRQLSIHDNRAAAASSFSDGGGAESSPTAAGPSSGEDWRSAFDAAANGPTDSWRSRSNGHSRRNSDPAQNGDISSGANSGSRRTPNRLPPAPPPSGSGYRSSFSYSHQTSSSSTSAIHPVNSSDLPEEPKPTDCPTLPNLTPTCTKISPSLAHALVHYATLNITPQQTLKEISVSLKVLENKSPCNFLVFGLGHDSLMWTALNHGGRTVFLEEDKSWIQQIQRQIPSLESYHVVYDTKVTQADELLEISTKEECKAVGDPRFSKCPLALKGLPNEVYDIEWDLIMVDAPTGYFDGAPGRMSAIYTAGLMARNRENGETDVFVHDVDRVVEDKFSKALLCEGYLREQEGRIRHFTIPSRSGRPFCP
ncbi:Dynamin-2A [Sesamum angolense]|uniref:dynamin GTPase n=1 Tax=Sesamum angolense TaxID=2727404 RepID=A0AAE2BMX0_9LAMI|nr:Dynamin-2A [Sesamum angolense]